MTILTTEEYNAILKKARTLLIYLYKKDDPFCELQNSAVKEIDALIGKSFHLYCVNVDQDPAIANVLDIKNVPAFVYLSDGRIINKSSGVLYTNQILDLVGNSK